MNKFKPLSDSTPLYEKKFFFFLWWCFPVFVAFLIEVFSGNFRSDRWLNFTENLIFASILLSFPFLISNKKLQRLTSSLFFSFFVFFVFFETLYYTWFGANFSASSIFVLFETNSAEASEFISFYINPFSILYASFSFVYVGLYWKLNCSKFTFHFSFVQKCSYFFILLGVLFFLRYTKLIDQNFPYLVARGVIEYRIEQKQLADLSIDQQTGHFTQVTSVKASPKTYVLVIGESTTKNHLQLYGYPRENMPNLFQRKDELLVFSDVVSSNAFTIGALKTALSLNNFEAESESTIVQLFNQAGFETHWISNQRPIGPYESIVTKMARASDYYTFTNTATAGNKTPYDEVLLPHFRAALERDTKKKFIVVHLLGTHLTYTDRFPEKFAYFSGMPPNMPFQHEEAVAKRNAYDNAVLYNDFLLEQIISEVAKSKGESYVLYFSDHGDEVYTTTDFAGHNDDNPTPAMFEIPLVLWHSSPNEDWKNYQNRPYSTKHIIHSIAELSGIKFTEWQASKSIFSTEFEEIPRIISGNRDYDEWLLMEK